MSLPTGTITFLLTDIEGSTKLWEEFPDAMRAALARHDALAAEIIAGHGGALIKSRGEGDSLFSVFASAPDALAAACALQLALFSESWPDETPLRVRMALHVGEADLREGDYYGPAVNRSARLRAIAYGGMVLLSGAVAQLTRDALPEETALKDMGLHRLKDLSRHEQIFQLLHASLPAEFPPLKSLDVLLNNLPSLPSSFVGREQEIGEVREALGKTRLLTITGAGGAGKTRLALQAAADLIDDYPDGVWLTELAPLTDPNLAPQTVASVLGVREEPGRPITQTLAEYLRPKTTLLLLDNCEHMLDACAQLADSLLKACPNVRILATSREGLGIAGEAAYRIPSLSLPDRKQPATPESVLQSEAARLFVERAQAGQPAFAVTPQNAAAVAQICARLDGIPLAIELAAARVRRLSAEQIAQRLDDRFRLLTGGSRAALPRQQTLRAAIDWSYDLLDEKEKTLLRRLSVFAGGWTLEAAEKVCADEG